MNRCTASVEQMGGCCVDGDGDGADAGKRTCTSYGAESCSLGRDAVPNNFGTCGFKLS